MGPTVKGPILIPTVVNSYSEYINIFGELIESGSDNYQFLTSDILKTSNLVCYNNYIHI